MGLDHWKACMRGILWRFFIGGLACVLLVALFAEHVQAASPCQARTDWPIYRVVPGDTLPLIAARYYIPVEDFARANCVASSQATRPGNKLRVPPLGASSYAQRSFMGTFAFERVDSQTSRPIVLENLYDGRSILETSQLLSDRPVTFTGTWRTLNGQVEITLDRQIVPVQEVLSDPQILDLGYQHGLLVALKVNQPPYGKSDLRPLLIPNLYNPSVRLLQGRLAQLAHFRLGASADQAKLYDLATMKAVKDFQHESGLPENGVIRPEDWDAISRAWSAWYMARKLQPGHIPDMKALPRFTEDHQPIAYLTFDDGPSENTEPILDLLTQYNAKASFFMLGMSAEAFPEMVRRVAAAGNTIGNHTHSHRSLAGISQKDFRAEVHEAYKAISKALYGVLNDQPREQVRLPTCLLRPPYGSMDANTKQYATALHCAIVLWTIDSGDYKTLNAEIIRLRVIWSAQPGAIILFHDGEGNRPQTLEALRQLIPLMVADGYVFQNIDLP